MTHPKEISNPALDEVLDAIGLPALFDAQGNPGRVNALFQSIGSRFAGRYPHHKLLAHLCEAAKDGTAAQFIARHRGLINENSM